MRPMSPPCLPFCALVPQMMSSTSAVLRSIALLQRLQHRRRQMLRMQMREGALADLADAARRADGIDDVRFGHFNSPQAAFDAVLRWRLYISITSPEVIGRGFSPGSSGAAPP